MTDMEQDAAVPELPVPVTEAGARRRVGVELEFSGLTEADTAAVVAEVCGVRAEPAGAGGWVCETAAFGTCEIYLDTRYRDALHRPGVEPALSAARQVVPVEIVTAPFDPARLADLDALRGRLRAAGARGSGQGTFLGFGLHLNVEIAALSAAHLGPVVTAFALLEPALRAADPLDLARRILPFVASYPDALRDELATRRIPDLDILADILLHHAPSRNFALDMLPILACHDPARVADASGEAKTVTARPAYHFRMPDCRIDEPDWRIAREWARWVRVEEVAASPRRLEALRAAYLHWRDRPALTREPWARLAAAHLDGREGAP